MRLHAHRLSVARFALALRSIANSILTARDRIATVHAAGSREDSPEPFFHMGIVTRFLIFVILLAAASAAQATTYYIDYSAGSNSNSGTSTSTPWKTHPYMKHVTGCDTGGPTYTHAAGDQFIFKGGATWPWQCFGMTIAAGGTSTAQDSYTTCGGQSTAPSACGGVTWPTSAWTRPKFDMSGNIVSTAGGFQVIYIAVNTAKYITIDDIEILNQGIGGLTITANRNNFRNQCAIGFGQTAPDYDPGTIVENVYIHAAVAATFTGSTLSNGDYANLGYCAGGIDGVQTVGPNVEISGEDSSNGGTTPTTANWYYFMGGALEAGEIKFSKIHGTVNGCDQLPIRSSGYSCHDNDLYHVSNAGQTNATIVGQIHSHVVFDNQTGSDFPSPANYNNAVHDNNAGLNIRVNEQANVYNDVEWNNINNVPLYIQCHTRATCTSTDVVNIYNNTMAITGGACLNSIGTMGIVNLKNNICIGGSGLGSITAATNNTATNRNMALSPEAATYGFVATNKYSPSSADPATTGTGTNLTSSCGALTALCSDTSGAPWFGGSYKPRGSSWDMGAYMFAGGTTGPPTLSITSPSPGTVSGSVNLQATCTPVSPATCSSVQYSIDGFPFGAAQTVSPYTLSWNTATAANVSHMITAVATDSNGRTGTAGTVTVTVSNSIPGCFISQDNDTGPLSFGANQSIGAQSSNFTLNVTVAPNTAMQNSVHALSENPMGAYSDGAALLRANSSGNWDAWNDTVGNYAAINTAPYSAGTAYIFSWTVNLTGPNAGTYSLSETSPSSIVIATNYVFRSTALIASLGYFNSISINDTPDTAKVCNVQVGTSTSLTFSPTSVNFGSVSIGNTPSQMINVSSAGGATTFTSVVLTGSGDFSKTNTCSGSLTSCSTTVQYAPSTTGPASATLTYTDSASGSPQTVAITGTGIPAASSATPSPTSINFGNVQLNLGHPVTSGPVTVALTNGPVTFTSITYDNPDFGTASTTCTGSVSAANCLITPEFTPSSLSTETATMTIHDDAPSGGSTQTVALVGTGSNFPTPAPAVNFVWNGAMPLTIKGKAYSIPVTCTCTFATSTCDCQ